MELRFILKTLKGICILMDYVYCLELVGYFVSGRLIESNLLKRKGTYVIFQFLTLAACVTLLIMLSEKPSYTKTILSFVVWFGLSGILI